MLIRVMILVCLFVASSSAAHEEIEEDHQGPFVGGGWTESMGGEPNVAFPSSNVTLRSWLSLDMLDPNAQRGSDCWGYTSPSGREYALVGTDTGTAIVEITNPGDAQLVEHIPGPVSSWRDLRTYSHFAYAVSEGGGGVQVFDLSDIDSGVVIDQGNVLTSPRPRSHNVNVNEVSGRLYRSGGGGGSVLGFRMYDLADPNLPVLMATWTDRYCHDALAVTWTDAPYVGREIVFCFANDTPSTGAPGVEILDATDPNAIVILGSIDLSLPPIFSHAASYSHQGWLSEDRQHLYVNDEVDEAVYSNNTLTRILDVSDLTDPQQVAIYVNPNSGARDHNLFVRGEQIFEANYRSGLRVLQRNSATDLVEVGYFDTYVEDDAASYNGLWGTFPYYATGTVIGSDIEKGLFVWTIGAVDVPTLPLGAFVALGVLLLAGVALAGPTASRRNS